MRTLLCALLCALLWLTAALCPGARASSDCGGNSLRSVCVGPSDPVFVPCPGLDSEDLTLILLQNQTPATSCHLDQSERRCVPAPSLPWTNQSAALTNHSAGLGFTLSVANERSHGLYVCEAKSKFPPPVQRKTGPETVLVLVRGHQCELKVDLRSEQVPGLSLVWPLSVVALSGYSLLTSILCTVLWVKLRGSDVEGDYVNARPLPSSKQRRNRDRSRS